MKLKTYQPKAVPIGACNLNLNSLVIAIIIGECEARDTHLMCVYTIATVNYILAYGIRLVYGSANHSVVRI